MIECHELMDLKMRQEIAVLLSTVEPMSVLESDLLEKDSLGDYHLVAKDAHGIFGTALLSKRRLVNLPEPLDTHLSFLGQGVIFELSLVHANVPPKFDATLPDHHELMESYCKIFYSELFAFLSSFVDQKSLLVCTTEEEQENMSYFGLWELPKPIREAGQFFGILKLLKKKNNPMDKFLLGSMRKEKVLH